MNHVSVTDTAKIIRSQLKRSFPGVRFSVRSRSYAGGASIDVSWTDGPQLGDVEAVAHAYQGASFDGQQDLKTYHAALEVGPEGLVEVHYGADFVFCHRLASTERLARARAVLEERHGREVVARLHPSWVDTALCRTCAYLDAAGNLPETFRYPLIEDGWLRA